MYMKRMNNTVNRILFGCLCVLTGCIGFQPIVLEEDTNKSKYSTENAVETGSGNVEVIENPKLKDGVFVNFQNELSGWWGGDAFKLVREESVLKVSINKTSAGYQQFGYSFDPKDFTNTPVVRVKMKLNGAESAKVRMDLRDANEMSTNATLVINEVTVSNEYRDYYFDFNNKFKQSWPNLGEVDARQISAMIFFINPGDKLYQGTLSIQEIYVMANKDGSGVVSKDILVEDFSGDINYWYGCDKERVLLSKEGEAMKVEFKSGQWACIGLGFDAKDITNNAVIKLRVKIQSSGKMPSVDILPYFIDVNNKTSNGVNIPQKIVVGIDYLDYFFDYRGKLRSEEGPFNIKEVTGITIFVNTQGTSSFSGFVYLDEISFVPTIPDYVSKRIAITKPTYINSSWPKGSEESVIDNFNSTSINWTAENPKLKVVSSNNTALQIISAGAGTDWEFITKNLSPVNLIEKPVIKIRVKAEGVSAPYLRISLTDNFGNTTNARPAEERIELKADYTDYYFDFTGRFQQRFPTVTYVNPGAIQKLNVYINGGMEPYNGTIYIDEIESLSVNDYLKLVK
jgi:hypothetical protein